MKRTLLILTLLVAPLLITTPGCNYVQRAFEPAPATTRERFVDVSANLKRLTDIVVQQREDGLLDDDDVLQMQPLLDRANAFLNTASSFRSDPAAFDEYVGRTEAAYQAARDEHNLLLEIP